MYLYENNNMKINNKKLLFERMEYLNPDFKQPMNESEQEIINDILSTNESVGDWWNKFINYGKKGLLTSTIILAIAFSTQAQQQNKTDDVLNTGIEMTNNVEVKQDVYNFIIGATLAGGKDYIRSGKMDDFKSSSELIQHYMALRNDETPQSLSQEAQDMGNIIFDMYKNKKISPELIEKLINDGKNIKNFTYNNSMKQK